MAQGSAWPAWASSIDHGCNNRYRGVRRVQGQAMGGIGILIGHGGQQRLSRGHVGPRFRQPAGLRHVR